MRVNVRNEGLQRLRIASRERRGRNIAAGDGEAIKAVEDVVLAFPESGERVSERMCKQVSVSLPYRGDSHDDDNI